MWIRAVNRKNGNRGKIWIPKDDDRLFSEHFADGFPSLSNPYPTLNLGHNHEDKQFCKPKRPAPKDITWRQRQPALQKGKSEKLLSGVSCS